VIYRVVLKNPSVFVSVYIIFDLYKEKLIVLSYISKKIGLEINVVKTKDTVSHHQNMNQG
jgi:hypothetical protein